MRRASVAANLSSVPFLEASDLASIHRCPLSKVRFREASDEAGNHRCHLSKLHQVNHMAPQLTVAVNGVSSKKMKDAGTQQLDATWGHMKNGPWRCTAKKRRAHKRAFQRSGTAPSATTTRFACAVPCTRRSHECYARPEKGRKTQFSNSLF